MTRSYTNSLPAVSRAGPDFSTTRHAAGGTTGRAGASRGGGGAVVSWETVGTRWIASGAAPSVALPGATGASGAGGVAGGTGRTTSGSLGDTAERAIGGPSGEGRIGWTGTGLVSSPVVTG